MLKHIQHIAKIILLLNSIWEDFIYEKMNYISTLTAGSLGHVAYVESVNSDGSITISEMNYTGGAYVTDTRTISASEVSAYNYIHLS